MQKCKKNRAIRFLFSGGSFKIHCPMDFTSCICLKHLELKIYVLGGPYLSFIKYKGNSFRFWWSVPSFHKNMRYYVMFLVVSFLSGLFASFSLFMILLYQVKIKMSITKLKIIKKIIINFKIDRKYYNYQKIINDNFLPLYSN